MKKSMVVTVFLSIVILLLETTNAFGFSSRSTMQEFKQAHEPVAATVPLSFSDIDGHWGEASISEINFLGIMNGYQNNTFRPNNPVTQLEALVMLVRMTGFDPASYTQKENYLLQEVFKVPNWAIPYVDYALKNDITYYKDLDKMTFNQPLIRQDAAVLVVRTLGLTRQAEKNEKPLSFSDVTTISPDAVGFVAIASSKGIITGTSQGAFLPTNPMSRAEMAAMLLRANPFMVKDSASETVVGLETITGTVQNVDASTNANITIALNNVNVQGEKFINLPNDLVIYKNSKRAELPQILPGDTVKLLLKPKNNATEALIIANSQPVPATFQLEKVNLSAAPALLQTSLTELKLREGFSAFREGNTLYLLACRGEKPNSGYSIEITEVVYSKDNTIRVNYITSDPAPNRFYLPSIMYPFSLVKISVEAKPTKVFFDNDVQSVEVPVKPI